MMQNKSIRLTLFVMHGDDDKDYKAAIAWLEKWADKVKIVDYSTGGWEHLWDIETTHDAATSLPEEWLCSSEWSEPSLFAKPESLLQRVINIFNNK
ncbi:MAG: hypothetical protein ACKVOA_10085 [Methylophilaceae bacterium]